MATYDDLTFGHGRDELLEQLHEVMVDFDNSDPVYLVAAMLWLDEQSGLRQDGDYVLMTPALAGWLLMAVTPTNPAIAQAMAVEGEDDETDETLVRLTSAQPFEAEFTSPHGEEYTARYPETIRGKKVLLRVMNEAEAAKLSFIYTVRADGTFIYLNDPNAPRTVQELQA